VPAPAHVPRILIVDDDEGLLVLMAETLRAEGHEVATAASGRAALQAVDGHAPDLMLLDLKLRDLDGPTLLAKLQEGATRVPFIVVTGQGDEKVAVEVMKRGALDYIMKDTALLDLLPAVVQRTLDAQAQARALAAAQTEHQRLEREVLAAAERERQSIGADLHDGLGQLLTAVGLMCTALKEDTAETQPAVAKNLEQMSGMLREAVAQTRYLARGLVPVGDEPDALQTGLTELAARTNGLGRVQCQIDCPATVLLADPAVTGQLYRIAQEAVNNAVKHSRAGRITIRLTQNARRLLLEVADDGIGLSEARAAGVGLGLMRHRASVIGAKLAIESKPRGGVTVACILPVKA
jgi:signal transduction histidine kinase